MPYRHTPYRHMVPHSVRWASPYLYHLGLPYRFIYWNRWVRWRSNTDDGFYNMNDYPYYSYNGYLHRYSSYDMCNYELVDGERNEIIGTFGNMSCREAYDSCSLKRDEYNDSARDDRYFCSEAIDPNQNYNWDPADDFYNDLDGDYYDDDFDYDA